ncbi:MAG TPA: VCBS repeat-containing protein [Kofleriaceae bacterium]|jgi:hypothetical protein
MRWLAVAACALAACGDNSLPDGESLSQASELVIAAVPGDELVVAEPDVVEAAQRGDLAVVYVIDGDTERVQRAYAAAAGASAAGWRCGWLDEGPGVVEHCRHDDARLSLVFVGVPPNTLLDVWEGNRSSASSRLARSTEYDQTKLIATLAAIVGDTRPSVIRTFEIAATHGTDDEDRMLAGALALLAAASTNSPAELVAVRGANVAAEPADQAAAIYTETSAIAAIAAPLDDTRAAQLHRRYAAGFRRVVAGQLDAGGQCLQITADGGLVTGTCDGTTWQLDTTRALRAGDRCPSVLPTGELVLGDCTGGTSQQFLFDDEGRIWAGVPPAPAPDMDYAHLSCLATGGGRVRAVLCGAAGAPAWTFDPAIATTPRAALGLTSTGRALRIADLTGDGHGDLCAVEAGALMCAPGDGTGAFGSATRIDDGAQPFAIDPRSLVLGDVDGDLAADACGLASDGSGILCALAASSFHVTPWSTAFAGAAATTATAASLAAVDGDVCGLSAAGMICAHAGDTPIALSAWPAAATLAWPGELDADTHPDWCAVTNATAGVACGVAAEAAVTTDGVPWSWSLAGAVDPAPASADTSALVDIDDDGRADLCALDGARVACARSQGRGFGPRTTLATFPGTTPTALVLGDLDGDGFADACVDTGTAIACALSL